MSKASVVKQPRRVLRYVVTLLVTALLAYATFLVSQSWREAKSDQSNQLATIADLSVIALDTYLAQLEIGMRNLGADLGTTQSRVDLDRAYELVNRFQALHTELGNVVLIRADGQILLTGLTPNNLNLPTLSKDLSFLKFRTELQQGRSFVIGQPVRGHVVNSWVSSARYAVTDHGGRLRYILSANLPPNLLQHYWSDSSSPKITSLGMVRDDGFLVSRYPEPDDANRDDMYGKPAADAMLEYLRKNDFPKRGQVYMPDSNGKVKFLRAVRRLQHQPVTLFVEMPMSEIKAAWWDDMHVPYFIMALLLASTFAIYSLSLRRRKAWSAAERREALRHDYEKALHERNPNEIFMFDSSTLQFTYANDYALEKLGYTINQLQQKNIFSLHQEIGVESFGSIIEPLRRKDQKAIRYQTSQTRADGSSYPVEVNLQLMTSDEGSEIFMAIINDITELRLASENLRAFNAPIERRATKRG